MRLLQVHGKMVALFNTICKLKGSMEVLIDFSYFNLKAYKN